MDVVDDLLAIMTADNKRIENNQDRLEREVSEMLQRHREQLAESTRLRERIQLLEVAQLRARIESLEKSSAINSAGTPSQG